MAETSNIDPLANVPDSAAPGKTKSALAALVRLLARQAAREWVETLPPAATKNTLGPTNNAPTQRDRA